MMPPQLNRYMRLLVLSILLINLTIQLHAHQDFGQSFITPILKNPNFLEDNIDYNHNVKDKMNRDNIEKSKNYIMPISTSTTSPYLISYPTPSSIPLSSVTSGKSHPLTILFNHPFTFWLSSSVSTLYKIGTMFSLVVTIYVIPRIGRQLVVYILKKIRNFIFTIIYAMTIIFVFCMIYPLLIDVLRSLTLPWEYLGVYYKYMFHYIISHLQMVPAAIITIILSYIMHGKTLSMVGLMWDWLSMEVSAGIAPVNHGGQPGHLPSSTTVPSINAVSPTTLQEDIRTHFPENEGITKDNKNLINETLEINNPTMKEMMAELIQNNKELNLTVTTLINKVDKFQRTIMESPRLIKPRESVISHIDSVIRSTEKKIKNKENNKIIQQQGLKAKAVSFEKHPNSNSFRKSSISSDSSVSSTVSSSSSISAPLAAAMLWRENDSADIDVVVPALDPDLEVKVGKKVKKQVQPIKSTPDEEQIIKELAGDQAALGEFLSERKKLRIKEKKKAELLTEDQKRAKPEELKMELIQRSHYQKHAPLDDDALTLEEQQMTRPQLLRVLREKSRQRWVEREHRLTGKPKYRCNICQNITVDGHHCWQANWGRGETRKGVPTERRMTISQNRPGQLRMSHMDFVDVPRMQQQYKAIRDVRSQMSEKLEEDRKRYEFQQSKLNSQISPINKAPEHLIQPRHDIDHTMGDVQPGVPSLIEYPPLCEFSTIPDQDDQSISSGPTTNPLIGLTYPSSSSVWQKPSKKHSFNPYNHRNQQSQGSNNKFYNYYGEGNRPQHGNKNNDIETFVGRDGKRYVNVKMINGGLRAIPMPNNLGSQSD